MRWLRPEEADAFQQSTLATRSPDCVLVQLGHQWEASLYDVDDGTWCPVCSRKHGKAENKVSSAQPQFCRGLVNAF